MRHTRLLLLLGIWECLFTMSPSASARIQITQVGETRATSVSCGIIELNPMDQERRIFTSFCVPDTFVVTISITDTLSKIISKVDRKECGPGRYQASWFFENKDGEVVCPGVYVFDLRARSPDTETLKEFKYRQRVLVIPSADDSGVRR